MRRRLLPVVAVLLFAGGVALAVLGARAINLERGAAERLLSETARQELAALRRRLAVGRPALPPPDETWTVEVASGGDAMSGAPEETRLRMEEAEFRERRGETKAALEILSRLAEETPTSAPSALAALRAGALARGAGDDTTATRLLSLAAAAKADLKTPEGPGVAVAALRHLVAIESAGESSASAERLLALLGPRGPALAGGAALDDGDVLRALAGELAERPPSKATATVRAALLAAAESSARGRAALAALSSREFAVVGGMLVARGDRVHGAEAVVAYAPASLAARWGGGGGGASAVGVAASPADVPEGAESTPAPAPFEGLTLFALPRVPLFPASGAPWVLAAGILAYAVGGGVSLVATARARRAARMQADFVAAVSHEMKTPIAAVQAMAEMLADERVTDPARARAYAERMRAEMVRLGATVRNVLDAARIERGEGARVAPRPMDPATVVEDLTAVVRPVLEARGYRFLVAAAPAPLPVATDPDALASVLTNLLDNAAKFAAAGREVAVEAGPTETGYRIAVLDRGPGVPEGDREHVFERFWRGRGAKEGAVPGVGLGLHVARELVRAHGGTIRVEAREGGGASFVVEWPREGAA